ncbi:polymorphic toxin-type HINT domain-containing protein [Amphritea balenae]|uniref:TadE-like domain-containing protein n=1 Tax=Amphritea balenae TaxID=452629 RepID=A0A3P1SN67_9GAMM|nr:polymorphic toxin-type HINT domain-containing protein [Amphritea balenae]RRC98606.1 hypothetical protein EHS89_13425 [Amphritea balenae]GGK65874.1 hypothetical protein GCM10007941_15130 [Amphritea balenae]
MEGLNRIKGRVRQLGVAAVESLIALPVITLLLMGAVEWARIYEAKTTVDHAVTMAARSGSFNNATVESIQQGFAKGVLPYYAPAKGQWKNALNKVVVSLATDTQVRILNPTREAFTDFGYQEGGKVYLPNDALHKLPTTLGNRSGINIQDANLLKVEVTWGLPLRMPVIGTLIAQFGEHFVAKTPKEVDLYSRGMMPITSTTALRMQSPAIRNNAMVRVNDLQGLDRKQGGPKERLITDAGSMFGDSSPGDGYQGLHEKLGLQDIPPPSTAGGDGDDDGQTDLDPEGTKPGSEEEEKEEDKGPDCEEPVEEEPEVDDDAGYFEKMWNDLVKLSKDAYNFVRGFWDGIVTQISDIYTMVTSPAETAKGLYELGKAFINDPEGTAKLIFEDLYNDFQKVAQCGPYDKGKIIGEYINPVFMLKLATKLTKYSDIAVAVKKTKVELGCASFGAGTEIWGAKGKTRIEQIAKGQLVASRSDTTFSDHPRKVTQVFGRIADHHYRLVTEADSILITAEHPVWVQGKGWVEVHQLQQDDVLASAYGDQRIAFVDRIDQPLQVYNFSVAETPSYFVGNGGIWVHNASAACALPGRIDSVQDVRLDVFNVTTVTGMVAEAKVNRILEEDLRLVAMGENNVNWRKLESEETFKDEYGKFVGGLVHEHNIYKGSKGVDSIYRVKGGTIYIVESKGSAVKESCTPGRLCKTKTGRQMSKDWLNPKRLGEAGLDDDEIAEVMRGLEKNNGSVVRLYAGTNKAGKTQFYEITDKDGSTSEVIRAPVGNEYKFNL